jgi:hypothetical protein
MEWKGDNLERTKIGPRSRTKVVLDEKSLNLILYCSHVGADYIVEQEQKQVKGV